MKPNSASESSFEQHTPWSGWIQRLARRTVLKKLMRVEADRIVLHEGPESRRLGAGAAGDALRVHVEVHDPSFYSDVAFRGTIGAGEAYMAGLWDCDTLTDLVRILLRNREAMDRMEGGTAALAWPLNKLYCWMRGNSLKGSRRNVHDHYDLGNDLFELFLDKTMMYSAAIFENSQATLEEASVAKLDRICQTLALTPDDHVLEIGTGWGGFALHAAGRYGCRVTTTTISEEQYRYAARRVREAGLDDRVTLLRDDYRTLRGQYDKLVSIEMIEAVGCDYFDTYFHQCSALLKAEGMMLLQAITIADQRYEETRRSLDFIQRYIFPGGCLPSVTALTDSITRASDMRLFHMTDIGQHYATTLRLWRERFLDNVDRVRALGYPETFIRMWMFYLCYCEAAFLERATGTVQMLLSKPECRRNALLPPVIS